MSPALRMQSNRDLRVQGLDDWQSVATVMKEVLKALEYMHDRGRVHRDVKVRQGLVDTPLWLQCSVWLQGRKGPEGISGF